MLRCLTLVDITYNGNKNQIRNWHTFLQTLSIRTQVTVNSFPKCVYRNINELGFGSEYADFHNVWIFDFECDDPENLSNNANDLYFLNYDVDKIPILGNLKNTAKFPKNCLFSNGNYQNISFIPLK